MLVRIPFVYSCAEAGAAEQLVIESRGFDVPVVQSDEMPHVFFCQIGPGRPWQKSQLHVMVGPGGGFYRNVEWKDAKGAPETVSVPATALVPGVGYSGQAYRRFISEMHLEDERARKLVESWYLSPSTETSALSPHNAARYRAESAKGRELAALGAEEFARRLVICSPNVYVACEEPKFMVSLDSELGPAVVTVWTGSTAIGTVVDAKLGLWVGPPDRTRFFPIDRPGKVREFLDGLGIDNDIRIASTITVTAPDVMVFDEARDIAARTVAYLVEKLSSEIGSMPRDAMEAWLDLRDRGGIEPPSATMDAVERILPHIADEDFAVSVGSCVEAWREAMAGGDARPALVPGPH